MDAVASALAAVTSTPAAVAAGVASAAHRRRSLSTEDVSSLDATDVNVSDVDTSAAAAAAASSTAASRSSSKRISGSPHPQVRNNSYSVLPVQHIA